MSVGSAPGSGLLGEAVTSGDVTISSKANFAKTQVIWREVPSTL